MEPDEEPNVAAVREVCEEVRAFSFWLLCFLCYSFTALGSLSFTVSQCTKKRGLKRIIVDIAHFLLTDFKQKAIHLLKTVLTIQ